MKIAREVESEVGSPGRDWGALKGDELMGYRTIVGLGTMPGEHLLGAIPCIDGGPPLTDPPGSTWGDTLLSAKLANLLPSASPALARPSGGVYIGEGVSPVPAKLAERIRRDEYVEMGELGAERGQVTQDPESGRHFHVAAEFCIICGGTESRGDTRADGIPGHRCPDYSGLAWVCYDQAYRRQAALTGHFKWSVINATLYTMCFTVQKRCELCLATSHIEQECAQAGDVDPGLKERLKTIESAMVALVREERPGPSPTRQLLKQETCRKWNSTGCSFPRCKYSHTCSSCGSDHPASRCSARPSQGSRGLPRPTAPGRTGPY